MVLSDMKAAKTNEQTNKKNKPKSGWNDWKEMLCDYFTVLK